MRRAGIMMKPYFNYFRNFYPLDQSLFYVAHGGTRLSTRPR